jgi:hypothetical protein
MSPREDVLSPELALVDPELRAYARAAAVVSYVVREPVAQPSGSRVDASPARRGVFGVSVGVLLATAVTGLSVLIAALGRPEPAAGPPPAESVGAAAARPAVPSKQISEVMRDGAAGIRKASFQPGDTTKTGAEPGDSHRPPRDEMATSSPSGAPEALVGGATMLAWDRVVPAPAYEVELVRDGALIHSATSETPSISLPRTWSHAGAAFALQPEDQLYVWPVVDGRRGRAVIDGRLALELTPVVLATAETTRETLDARG